MNSVNPVKGWAGGQAALEVANKSCEFCKSCQGVGLGEGDGVGRCSEGGMLAGFGLSGDECRWIAFHAVPTRLKANVMRPVAVSGVPL